MQLNLRETPPVEQAVRERYSAGASAVDAALCCPVRYDSRHLAAIPPEVLARDYGCGDPTPYVRPGDTVLDLGCGGGKVCFIAAQLAGPSGRVLGVDCNHDMLALARRSQPVFAAAVGYDTVSFRTGLIQDLRLDLDRLADELARAPVGSQWDWLRLRDSEERLRCQAPLVADASVDCVLSNCVLNLVRPDDRLQLFRELARVLRPGGRAAISDIVADAEVPEHLRRDSALWSGCISGAFREDRFLQAFADAGLHGITLAARQETPWRVVEGIVFRSVTVVAYRPIVATGAVAEAVIYRGPFRRVEDDAGQTYARGETTPVDAATCARLHQEPYAGQFASVGATADTACCQPREKCC